MGRRLHTPQNSTTASATRSWRASGRPSRTAVARAAAREAPARSSAAAARRASSRAGSWSASSAVSSAESMASVSSHKGRPRRSSRRRRTGDVVQMDAISSATAGGRWSRMLAPRSCSRACRCSHWPATSLAAAARAGLPATYAPSCTKRPSQSSVAGEGRGSTSDRYWPTAATARVMPTANTSRVRALDGSLARACQGHPKYLLVSTAKCW
mmetsp:Transcript_18417/g.61656  ORF Transcript_18417/g.61656 Transcript_18417/m.61656 type:complete len:212 (+) Transcript_18417:698-1333(+)